MERCHKKRAFPALRSPLKEPRAQLQEEYIGPSCMECAKYQVHALPRYLESYQHTYQLDTSLFDWNIVGDNEWRVNLLLPGGIYMFHNEHFHVTYVATTGLPPLFSCINPSKKRMFGSSDEEAHVTIEMETLDVQRRQRIKASLLQVHTIFFLLLYFHTHIIFFFSCLTI
jgi:hypothetical protein